MNFPGALVIENLPANSEDARDADSIPGWRRASGVGNGDLLQLQYSCLEDSKDRGAWQAAVHRFTKSQTQLSD